MADEKKVDLDLDSLLSHSEYLLKISPEFGGRVAPDVLLALVKRAKLAGEFERERDTLKHWFSDATSERDALRAERDALRAERDAMAALLVECRTPLADMDRPCDRELISRIDAFENSERKAKEGIEGDDVPVIRSEDIAALKEDSLRLDAIRGHLEMDDYGYWLPVWCVKECHDDASGSSAPSADEFRSALDARIKMRNQSAKSTKP
jgi:hypothetical protein